MSTYEGNRYNFNGANLTALNGSNIASGTVPNARITLDASEIPDLPTSKITSGTFDNARLSSGSVTQHVDLSNLSASNLTSGTMPDARFPATLPAVSGANLTSMSVASSVGSWSPSINYHSWSFHQARYVKVGRICFVSLYFQWTASGGGGGDEAVYMSGLPFTSWNSGNPIGQGSYYGSYDEGQCLVMANSTAMDFLSNGNGQRVINEHNSTGGLWNRSKTLYPSYLGSEYRYFYAECTYITAS
tara:strand:+ start:12095 stop:12829 length:735 start_codon:yes stop_codon:yes gene_type:complete